MKLFRMPGLLAWRPPPRSPSSDAAYRGSYTPSMAAMDPAYEELFLGIAHALFVNRLHVLRLTEVVRLGIKPDPHDQNMEVPQEIDRELIQQAFAYVLLYFPQAFGGKIEVAKARWIRHA